LAHRIPIAPMPSRNKFFIRYEVDPHNRLVAIKTRKKSGVVYFRKILDGKFYIDNNSLIFHVKKSAREDTLQQVKLKGEFSLDKDHCLNFTLDKWGNQVFANRLILKTEIVDVKENRISFSLVTKDTERNSQFYMLKLAGVWNADKFNRLRFDINKENLPSGGGSLTFEGCWRVNNNNEIIYSYTTNSKGKKEDTKKILVFKGFWNISDKFRVLYCLNKSIKSFFDFKVGLACYSKNALVFEADIGLAPKKRIFTLQ